MFRPIFTYGLIAGAIVGAPMLLFMMLWGEDAHEHMSPLIGYTIMLVALSLIFLAVKRHRDVDGGGVIKFLPALGLGLGISAVAGVIYVASWEVVLAVTGMDFAGEYVAMMIEQKRAAGASAEELAAFTAEMNGFVAQYANPLFRLPMTFTEIFPVGVLVSVISAALLRNPRFLPARRT